MIVRNLARGLCLLLVLAQGAAFAAEALAFPERYEQWVQERVGPVIYPAEAQPQHGWDELTSVALTVGARAVKTWVGPQNPGDASKIIQSPAYLRLIRDFQIVHLNLSPWYIGTGYRDGKINPDMLKAIQQEWRDVAALLCRLSTRPDQIFLISVGGEINVYFGTQRTHPDFPVAEYVNACHDALTEALAKIPQPHPAVYSVAEFQTDMEYETFAARWAPEFKTDLISLSHYTFYRDVKEALKIIQPYVKPLGPFGANRFMLGEYGPTMEICNWNQAAQVRANDRILRDAFDNKFQFAFFYEIADEPTVIRASGHDGLVGWNEDGTPYQRLLWAFYHDLFQGRRHSYPQFELYEVHDRHPPITNKQLTNLALEAVTGPEKYQAGDRVVFKARIHNPSDMDAPATVVSFFIDDVLVSYVPLPPIKAGGELVVGSDEHDKRFAWTATPGTHSVKGVIDRRRQMREVTEDDNCREMWIAVKPAAAAANKETK